MNPRLLLLFCVVPLALVSCAAPGIETTAPNLEYLVREAAKARAAEDAIYGPVPEGCTSIMVGRLATTDGSVITSHTCDGRYRTWLAVAPGKKHKKDDLAPVYKGRMRTEFPTDERGVVKTGEVPQAEETYAILDTAYPCMNEHQLAMGESTFGGRGELKSDQGIFYVEELQRIALERTKTARDAARLMGDLATEYGYIDSGEALTVADPREVWHFEIMGPGKGKKGAVWAAVRIPDDHVGVAANISRIGRLDLDDPDRCMASENVFSLAEEMGWWKPKSNETFKFWKAYSGRKPFRLREFWIFNTLAPSLNLDFFHAEELPFSVKPDRKVSVQDVFRLFQETYEGTRYALNWNLMVEKPKKKPAKKKEKSEKTEKKEAKAAEKVDPRLVEEMMGKGNRVDVEWETCAHAHPWMSRDMQTLFNRLKPGVVTFHRPIAVMFNAYHTVIQCREWLPDSVGGICWLGFDNPATTPRVPIFAGVKDLPADFKVDNHKKYRTDSASWAFRRASRLACIRWGSNKEKVQKKILELEARALEDLPFVEKRFLELFEKNPKKAQEFLTQYTISFCRSMTHEYWQLGDELWMEYLYHL